MKGIKYPKKNESLQAICDLIKSGVAFNLVRKYEFDGSSLEREIIDVAEAEQENGYVSSVSVADLQSESLIKGLMVSESIRPRYRLLVFGGGHVGQAVSLIASFVGYDVTVIDDRADIITRDRFPDNRIDLKIMAMDGDYGEFLINSNTAIVIVTRGHQYDEECLKRFLGHKSSYVGMIGSKRRVISIFNKLEREGFLLRDIKKVHAPIGLDIGAKSPQEIGLAIVGEIIAHRAGRCNRVNCREET